MLVLDASAFLAITLADEVSTEAEAMKYALAAAGAIVPPIWALEIQNVLLIAERSGRITGDAAVAAMQYAKAGHIVVDTVNATPSFGAEYALARHHNLSIYDATYLELAQRLNTPLMTVDRNLRAAAEALGLAWTKGYSPLVVPKRRLRRKKIPV